MKSWWIVVACLIAPASGGCQTRPQQSQESAVSRDGSSATRAVRLEAASHVEGLEAERSWLDQHYPGWRFAEGGRDQDGDEVVYFPHRTEGDEKAIYSVYTIMLPDGRVREVYFDQTEYLKIEEKSQPAGPAQRR